ncbi:ArsR/SmtB family transcription factor [Actinopolyspora saharensis]|uniref:DNA-binding transcriptional regulator, ArsR family n=1 Tax=Actinopolyspora saharensis TaxID=995062 RepID=A0A1H0ZNK7_9ACTN|nr:helix-turn-helix domain-containing protein [Actinopolyspora saharensis]SDQ29013.1 DNA-binding transcriptional regulator, ArsR family [Actinopolyspora saharensis]
MVTTRGRQRTGKPLPQPDLDEIEVEQVLRALGEPVRLRIVRNLAAAEQPMACSAFHLGVSKSTSTHHFRLLRESGIIAQHEQGTSRYSELRSDELEDRFPGLLAAILAAPPKRPASE